MVIGIGQPPRQYFLSARKFILLSPKLIWNINCQLGESPVWSPQSQNLLFVDIKAKSLLRWSQGGSREQYSVVEEIDSFTLCKNSENESNQAAGLIKLFRKSAHATRNNSTIVTVPGHCIVSFHGVEKMIQIPPCYVESVNVTYNLNVPTAI